MIYTAYQIFCLFGYLVIAVLVWNRTGLSPSHYADHYRGNEAMEVYAQTPTQLLETTHFHLFSYPVFLLIQGHIFLLTSWGRKSKAAVVLAAFVGCGLYLLAPWLVLGISPGLAWVSTLARGLLVPSLVLFWVVPLREMWWRRDRSSID
jgi:hypothetical protein